MIRIEREREGCVHIVGTLEFFALRSLIESACGSALELDLSEVHMADGDAVRLLARLPAGAFRLVACPRWLEVWIDSERRHAPEDGRPPAAAD